MIVRKVGRREGPGAAREAQPQTVLDERSPLTAAYRHAIERYLPRRYPGRIAVIRAAETHSARPDLGWASLADQVEVHLVPGDHFTSITRHAEAVGERLRACLRGTQSR